MVWTGSSVVFRFRIVREFCFVKYDASGVSVWDAGGEIPAYAGMTWEGLWIEDCRLGIGDCRLQDVSLGCGFVGVAMSLG